MADKGPLYLLLTGPPGIGKTTVVRKVCDMLRQKGIPLKGFYTEEIRQEGKRVGFDVVTLTGSRGSLARLKSPAPHSPTVGKYFVDVKSFEDLVLPVLKGCSSGGKDVLILDEIGSMEMKSRPFVKEVEHIFHTEGVILATVPVRDNMLSSQLRLKATKIFTVDYQNRNSLSDSIGNILISSLVK